MKTNKNRHGYKSNGLKLSDIRRLHEIREPTKFIVKNYLIYRLPGVQRATKDKSSSFKAQFSIIAVLKHAISFIDLSHIMTVR